MHVLRGQVITPTMVIPDGVITVAGGHITHVGAWADAPATIRETHTPARPERYLAPALVDVHNHGGGGVSFPDTTSLGDVGVAVGEHQAHGTMRMLASLVTADPDVLRERTALLADAADAGLIAGIHLEGPFLSALRCGAQNPAAIIPADPRLTADLLSIGRGYVRTMTIAPESAGARDAIKVLIDGGAVPSFGHTDADSEVMREAINYTVEMLEGTGRRATVTHLFNGMRPVHHRAPGPVPPALSAAKRGEVVLELIGDGAHLNPQIVRDVFELVGADNIALVTDAMAATGMPDGAYRLGSLDIVVSGGLARLADGTSMAGGTAHLLDVVRTTVAGGVPLADAVRSATLVPARIIDPQATFGALQVGYAAEIIELDENLRLING